MNELIAPGDLAPGAEELTNDVANGRRVEREAFRQRKDGSRVYVSVLAVPVVTSSGQIAEDVIYRNVGERLWTIQALLESEARNRAFLDNSPNIIFLKDIRGRYLLANKEFEKASKVVEQDIRGRRDDVIFSPPQDAPFRATALSVVHSPAPFAS